MTDADRLKIRQSLTDKDAAIATLYGEARGEIEAGRIAVMAVIRNRVMHPCYWGNTIAGVCLHPWAFSCWWYADPKNPQDSNRDATYAFAQRLLDPSTKDPLIDTLGAIVDGVMAGTIADPTAGACMYDTTALWLAQGRTQYPGAIVTAKIGHQTFFTI